MSAFLFILMIPVYLIYLLAAILLVIDFVHFMVRGIHLFGKLYRAIEMIILFTALASLFLDSFNANECCRGFTLFSPEHGISVYVLIGLVTIAFFYSSCRARIAAPIMEAIINCLLLTGIVVDVLVAVQLNDGFLRIYFSVPVAILLIFMLIRNHQMLLSAIEEPERMSLLGRFCWDLLHLRLIQKIPILLVLCVPLIVLIGGILLVFGQKPDSFVRAFAETYHYGFSQMTKECNTAMCGDHFLCTIAAKGHAPLVRPLRYGIRGGKRIICNRQLLVSNAFEEWMQEHVLALHRPLRRNYNRVGALVHRYYGMFDKKWVADGVYILMKPLEWAFVLFLYGFDRQPEKRIARQYT